MGAYRLTRFEQELALYFTWHNGHRPHSGLRGATLDEVYFHRRPRFPRPALRTAPTPQALVRGRPGAKLDLSVQFLADRKHLSIVTLKRAA
jgi:hypothetical protein